MRILHLNTHSYGGAAVVARRLHTAALNTAINSDFLTKYGLPSDGTARYAAMHDARLLYKLRGMAADARLYQVGKLVQKLGRHKNLAGRPEGYDVFSAIGEGERYADCARAYDPDVIHLHWINGFVDNAAFFRQNRARKFVWTLHDMNPFTGGCHHADGCEGFAGECSECPQLAGTIDSHYSHAVLDAKVRMLAPIADDQLVVVGPSQWILDLSRRSRVLGRFRHVHVDNPAMPVPASEEPATLRRALGLPLDKKIVLFVSDNLRNSRKGFDLLFDAARRLARRNDVHFVGLGQRTDVPDGLSVSFPGRTTDEALTARYYACADLVVNASAAENSPLALIEALSNGTPVVAFAVGGIPELVDAASGILAPSRTVESLGAALNQALFERAFLRSEIRTRAARFAPALVAEKYNTIYQALVAPEHALQQSEAV